MKPPKTLYMVEWTGAYSWDPTKRVHTSTRMYRKLSSAQKAHGPRSLIGKKRILAYGEPVEVEL